MLGTILGPMAESNFMTTMVSFDNDWTVFFTDPLSLALLIIAAVPCTVASAFWCAVFC